MTDDTAIFARHIRPLGPIPTGVAPDLTRMQEFEALLFDVYGTLLISSAGDIGVTQQPPGRSDVLQDLLRRYDIHRSPKSLREALQQAIHQAHSISRKRGIDYPEVDIAQIWQQVLGSDDKRQIAAFALEYELIVNPVYPMPGLEALLLACSAQHVPMGIISNAQFFTPVLLEHFLGATLDRRGFDSRLIFFSYRFGWAKPSDIMFTRAKDALSSMGIPTASTLYVGNDMRNDILAAKTIGFKTALFAGDRRSLRRRGSDDRCRNLSPDLIITDLLQLINGAVKP